MPTRPLFTITSILVVGLGLAWLVVPEQMLLSWGATPDQTLVYMSRRYAVLFFGYGAMLWGSRSASPSPTRRWIVLGTLLTTALMGTMSLVGVVTQTIAFSGLLALVVEGALTAGFAWALLVGPDRGDRGDRP
jgi:hypothetical protein